MMTPKTPLKSLLVTLMVTSLKPVSTPEATPPPRTSPSRPRSKGLRELVDLYRDRLSDADWRYQELLEQLKTMTKALPMATEESQRPNRWWWPFR